MSYNYFDEGRYKSDGRSNCSFPETARSIFDPIVDLANRKMALVTCQIFDAIAREERARKIRPRIVRPDDL